MVLIPLAVAALDVAVVPEDPADTTSTQTGKDVRPEEVLELIRSTIDEGDVYLNAGDFEKAVETFKRAISLIPVPKIGHDSALSAFTALGEAYLFSDRYAEARAAFLEALKAPGGVDNPLVNLRLGQACFELGMLPDAAIALTKAYALDGLDVFEDEDEKYLDYLKSVIDI